MLFIWNSNLTGYSLFSLAKSGCPKTDRQTHTHTESRNRKNYRQVLGLVLFMQLLLKWIYSSFSIIFQLNSGGFLDEIESYPFIIGLSWFSLFQEIMIFNSRKYFLLNFTNEFAKCPIICKLMLIFHLEQKSIFLSSLMGCWLNEYFALLRVEVDSINKTHWLFKSPMFCAPVPTNHTKAAYPSSSWFWWILYVINPDLQHWVITWGFLLTKVQ